MERKESVWTGIRKRRAGGGKIKGILRHCALGHTCTQDSKKLLEKVGK